MGHRSANSDTEIVLAVNRMVWSLYSSQMIRGLLRILWGRTWKMRELEERAMWRASVR